MVMDQRSQALIERKSQSDSQLANTKNGVDHSKREQSGKTHAIARHNKLGDARQQVRQCQRIDEGPKRGDMFESGHPNLLVRIASLQFRKETLGIH